jgi:flagellar hook-associated protein 3 FlgL
MRVTDLTKHNAVARHMSTASEQVSHMQETMSSGKRINKLSDDPIGSTQAQDFKTKLSFFDAIKRNIQSNYVMLDRYEAELGDIGELLQNAKTLILAQSNANADQATREVTASELQSIIDELYTAGNSKVGKLFLFSGTQTLTPALAKNPEMQAAAVDDDQVDHLGDLTIDMLTGAGAGAVAGVVPPLSAVLDPVTGAVVGTGAGVAWNLLSRDVFGADFTGYSQNDYLVKVTREGEIGRARYVVSDDGGKTWSQERTLLKDNPVVNEDGKLDDRVRLLFRAPEIANIEAPIVFPEGLQFRFVPNPPIAFQGNDEKRMVPTGEGSYLPVNFTAREVFYQRETDPDSIDVFDLLFTLKRALTDDQPKVLEERIDEVDKAMNQVLARRADVGSTRGELERQFNKLEDRGFAKTKELSDLEDLDLQEAVVELNLAEMRNQATLNTGARLLQPSLLEFLR